MTEFKFTGIFILFSLMLYSCSTSDPSLSFEIPKDGFEIVQYIRQGESGREENALYLPPRPIDEDEFSTEELNRYIDSMYAIMLRNAGVGIASNQLGKRLQIFIIEAKSDNPRYKVLGPVLKQVFINPRITKTSRNRMNFWHGCLSAKNEMRGNVATYEWIEYECRDVTGKLQRGKLDGFASVIFQHEFRHLMNGTYLDHANHFLPKSQLDKKLDSGDLPFFDHASDTLPLLIEGYVVGETLDEFHNINHAH